MIIVLKPNAEKEKIMLFKSALEEKYKVTVNAWVGVESTVLGLIGDTTHIDEDWVYAQEVVENVKRVQAVTAVSVLWQVPALSKLRNKLTTLHRGLKRQGRLF